MAARLSVQFLNGSRSGQSLGFDLSENPKVVCGSDEKAQLHFSKSQYPMVSRRHLAVVYERDNGSLEALDTSIEGTFSNGNRLRRETIDGELEVELGKGGPRLRLRLERLKIKATPASSQAAEEVVERPAVSERSLFKMSRLAGAVLGLVALTVGLVSWLVGDSDKGVDEVEALDARFAEAQREMEERVASSMNSIEAELEKTKRKLNSSLLDVDESVSGARARADEAEAAASGIKTDSEMFITAARRYEKAVVLVSNGATAFAIAPRILATNAHVSEGDPSYVYLNRGKGRRLNVVKSVTHSRYNERDDSAGGMFDVGLLYVDEDMPVFFKIAGEKELRKVDSGYTLAYLGFPSEGLSGGGVSVKAPVATMKTGIVTTASDFWLAEADFPNRKLIRHNLGTAGGASGSPIFNRKGEVVAIHNAGNYALQIDGKRVQSGAMISFAQRIDCLKGIWGDYPDDDE